jgi:hypothetical protein
VKGDSIGRDFDLVDVFSGLAELEVAGPVSWKQIHQAFDHCELERLSSLDRGRIGEDREGAIEISWSEPRDRHEPKDTTFVRLPPRAAAASVVAMKLSLGANLTAWTAVGVAATAITGTSAAAPARPELSRPPGAPAAFLAQIVRLLAANRYAEAWPSLNPLQQSIAPLPAYVACESQSPIPGQLTSLRILHVRREPVRVLPEQPPVPSIAATFVLRIAGAAVPEGVRVVLTAHAVAVGTHWTWILPPARLGLYREGCGTDPATTP